MVHLPWPNLPHTLTQPRPLPQSVVREVNRLGVMIDLVTGPRSSIRKVVPIAAVSLVVPVAVLTTGLQLLRVT